MAVEIRSESEALFDAMYAAFSSAVQSNGLDEHLFGIGGSRICLKFAGTAMQSSILPAITHLSIDRPHESDLEILIGDSASNRVAMPPPPSSVTELHARGEIWSTPEDENIHVAYHPGSGILSILNIPLRIGVMWIGDAEEIPYYERAAPLRSIFHWWFSSLGCQVVHAAAVGTDSSAVLITGRGGSGKSTTALTSLFSGFNYIGDDYVLCSFADESAPTAVYSLYNSAKVDRDALPRLPGLSDKLENEDRLDCEKGIVFTMKHYPELVSRGSPLSAILIPRITNNVDTKIHPIKPSLAFLAIAPTTLFQLPEAHQATAFFLRRLVEKLPCYQLELGLDSYQPPDQIVKLVTRLSS